MKCREATIHRHNVKIAALVATLLLYLVPMPMQTWAQSKARSRHKPPASSTYLPLSQYSLKNLVTGIDYPDWFGDSRISATDREYLVGLFNEREWIRFQDSVGVVADPHVTLSNGQTVSLQPIVDALEAAGSAVTADSSKAAQDERGRLRIKSREGQEGDSPAAAESSGNADIDIIDRELRWYRLTKYRIPPTISSQGSLKKAAPRSSVKKTCDNAGLDACGQACDAKWIGINAIAWTTCTGDCTKKYAQCYR